MRNVIPLMLHIRSKFVLIYIIWTLVLVSCGWHPVRQFHYIDHLTEPPTRGAEDQSCDESEYFIPWHGKTVLTPLRTIMVNFHFMNSLDGSKNLSGNEAVRFALDLLKSANHNLENNQPMRLPLHNHTPVLDPLIRYELGLKEDGSPAIYEHFDDGYYYLVKKGPYRNNYDRSVIDQYGIGQDSILNVFVQVPPPDSMMVKDYGGLKTGVALRNGIRVSGPLLTDSRAWSYAGMFNHEVGHILGLRHSWVGDQCDDTPNHANCWNFTHDGSVCDSLVSNNVMDSNADLNALTPCQIGIVQRSLTRGNGPGRHFVKRDYCLPQYDLPLYISDTVYWCREIDVLSDIVIGRKGRLVISNRVSMPRDSRILIKKGGQLILRKTARMQNGCGYTWKGLYVKSGKEGQVVIEKGAVIEGIGDQAQ